MDNWALAAANIGGLMVIFGAITLCVRFDQRGKTRRRELEHTERMKAIDLGRPLDDAAVARYQALGAVGVAVPVVSLSAAVLGSCFAGMVQEPAWRFGTLGVVWAVCGAVALTAVPLVAARLREGPPRPPPAPPD